MSNELLYTKSKPIRTAARAYGSVSRLADRSRIDLETVRSIIDNGGIVPRDIAARFARAVGVPLRELFEVRQRPVTLHRMVTEPGIFGDVIDLDP